MPKYEHVVVFDLDDTLYKERDYVLSGVAAVIKACLDLGLIEQSVAKKPFTPDIAAGKIINTLCRHLSLPEKLEDSLLWIYRLHEPSISLDSATRLAIRRISDMAAATAIVTDGRATTQRIKLKALGLGAIPAYISEEFGNGKPATDMFLAVERRWPGFQYTYIGDNVSKDFIAPNKLGWFTIGIKDDGCNIHSQSRSYRELRETQPKAWAASFAAVPQLIFGNRISQGTSR